MPSASTDLQSASLATHNVAQTEDRALSLMSLAKSSIVRFRRDGHRAPVKSKLEHLTGQQIAIVTTLMAKILEANRALVAVTSLMRRAALKGDRHPFDRAQEQSRQTLRLCDSYMLAVDSVVDAFAEPRPRECI